MLDHKDENKDGYCDECEELTCKHVETVVVNANPANCEYDGYSGDTVCVQCGHEISKGEIIPKTKHSWGGTPIEIIPATCSDAKTLVYKCRYCQKTENRYEGNPDKEAHTIIVLETIEPTCENVGYVYYICTLCSTSTEFKVIEAKGHIDEDGDGVCDASECLKSQKPGVPDGCSCICHSKGFFMQLIYKIVRFFWKLFKISPSCKCGAVHY
ncbi:MAG: hypothetical protein IIX36_05255, partial [Clostridia bacterium]|nr:hypothetical protein [Clostridia bacterium]